jgi:hypothetical protein
MKLTPWFPGSTPPVREGWYEFFTSLYHPYSDGKPSQFMAYYYPNQQTFHLQKTDPGYAIASFDKWRGVAK